MTGIFPVPSGRTSDILRLRRLNEQIKTDQNALTALQNQVSTGRRIVRPSEDPQAATRAITVQRIIEQKSQFQVNLNTSGSYLGATETALSQVTGILRDVKGEVLTASNTTTTNQQRDAIVDVLQNSISDLINIGNSKFRDRYLFAGSNTTIRPYEQVNDRVIFHGNEGSLSSYVDFQNLIKATLSGNQALGGLSAEIKGTVDLNPVLTSQTKLAELNGGQGVTDGSFTISDGNATSTIDISSAETVGDVVRLIESNPPTGRSLAVELQSDRLRVFLSDGQPGSILISETAGGTTGADLGILSNGSSGSSVVGFDLNPVLQRTTNIDDILGTKSTALLSSNGDNNDILLTANQVGSTTNGVTFQYVDDSLLQAAPGATKGNEFVNYSTSATAARAAVTFTGSNNNLILTGGAAGTSLNNVQVRVLSGGAIGNAASVSYNAVNKTYDILVDSSGATQISTVISEINTEATFTAAYDSSIPSDGGLVGTATIPSGDINTVTGNTTNSGGAANTAFIHVDDVNSTANNVITALQANSFVNTNFDIQLDKIDAVTSSNTGGGIVSLSGNVASAGGSGQSLDRASGIRIEVGTTAHTFDTTNVQTVEDLLNTFNVSDANLLAEINDAGTGINIRSRVSGVDLSIGENGGTTATQLGLRSLTTSTKLSELNYGRGVHSATGTDFTIRRNDGVSLEIDISTAKTVNDVINIINNHPSNQVTASKVTARLSATGNSIELVDDDPPATATLSVTKSITSEAAIHLGLVPKGQEVAYPSNSAPPTAATLAVQFANPNEFNTAFDLTAQQVGTELNGVQVQFVNTSASGDQALVNYNASSKILTIDVDPAATTAKTVVQAIGLEGTFGAALNRANDPGNSGSGLIATTGTVGATSGGSSQPAAQKATANLSFSTATNTSLTVTAVLAGTQYNGVDVEFRNTLSGNSATATYDSSAKKLYVDIDTSATTTSTIITAIDTEGTFDAALDTTTDATNDGSGLPGTAGVAATTANGTAEVFVGKNPNPSKTNSVFDTITRIISELSKTDVDYGELEWLAGELDQNTEQVNAAFSDIGARNQTVELMKFRIEDEQIELQETLSNEIDVDLVQAISNLNAQQATLQASLQMLGRSFQLTLLDFL